MKPQRLRHCGFTLLELLTVVVVIMILITMLVPVFSHLRGRAERGSCVNNLRGLYVAASAYLDTQQHWPQVSPRLIKSSPESYAEQWYAALAPYGIGKVNWVCPTVQRELRTNLEDPKNARVDYLATPFDSNPQTPRKYATHPWFVERGSVHGDGNLMIFANGQVTSLKEVTKNRGQSRSR